MNSRPLDVGYGREGENGEMREGREEREMRRGRGRGIRVGKTQIESDTKTHKETEKDT